VAGNLLQGVLSRRLEVRTRLPALEAYRNLRSVNPSPYLFYLDFDRFQLFGASPEVHVKVKKGTVTVRPIAGTRPRGRDDREELALEKELLADEKERAEHLMLVDLARNDIGRVCRPGSVRVTESMAVERYSHVIHMVSQVQGELTAGRNGIDAVRATFPAGTVSGAPKIRAIETIDALEPFRRGFYAGIVGYVEPGGSLDTCITIRSAVKIGDRLVLQAGAGIVYDSVPEREYEETENKLRALTVAAGLSVGTSNDGPSTAERRSGAVPVTADGDTADADVSTADRRSGANAGEPA
jgi:anthranilate synthase component 1